MLRKDQATQDVIIDVSMMQKDGTQVQSLAVSSFTTAIIKPDGTALVNYTEPTITNPVSLGLYVCKFPTSANSKAFTLVNQPNPYQFVLDHPETDVEPMGRDVWITDLYPWDVAKQVDVITVRYILELLRGTHGSTGNVYYWDPINGNDSNDGLSKATARLTFASINTNLVTAFNHDTIIIIPGEAAAQTVITETIDMDKACTFLRGPGRDVKFKPTTSTDDTVTLSAVGCELSGCIVETHTAGAKDAIKITGDLTLIHHVQVDYSRGNGISIDGASNCILRDFIIQTAAAGGSGHGLVVEGASVRNLVINGQCLENSGDGIRVVGPNTEHVFFINMVVHNNTGYGVNETASADHTIVLGGHYGHNTSGDINLSGGESLAEKLGQWLLSSDYTAPDNDGIAAIRTVTDNLSGQPDAVDVGGITEGRPRIEAGDTYQFKLQLFSVPDSGVDVNIWDPSSTLVTSLASATQSGTSVNFYYHHTTTTSWFTTATGSYAQHVLEWIIYRATGNDRVKEYFEVIQTD